MDKCRVYWSSHGCDSPRGHPGIHVCMNEEKGKICSAMMELESTDYWIVSDKGGDINEHPGIVLYDDGKAWLTVAFGEDVKQRA
jgi:hypothetical protein